jgi:hypothetical protein
MAELVKELSGVYWPKSRRLYLPELKIVFPLELAK